jgi:hypothetical protein
MAEQSARDIVQSLDLTASQQAALGEIVAASVAVNVYQQLARVRAAESSGCNIIGNCSSCSKVMN